jgi:hypothetical protein
VDDWKLIWAGNVLSDALCNVLWQGVALSVSCTIQRILLTPHLSCTAFPQLIRADHGPELPKHDSYSMPDMEVYRSSSCQVSTHPVSPGCARMRHSPEDKNDAIMLVRWSRALLISSAPAPCVSSGMADNGMPSSCGTRGGMCRKKVERMTVGAATSTHCDGQC